MRSRDLNFKLISGFAVLSIVLVSFGYEQFGAALMVAASTLSLMRLMADRLFVRV